MLLLTALLACSGQGDTDSTDTEATTDLPSVYDFDSRFTDGSSVGYSGQVFRHLLVTEMKSHIGGLTARVDEGWFPESGEVVEELEFYLAFDSDSSGQVPLTFSCDPTCAQAVFDDVSTDKDLWGKLAGNDPVGQTVDWNSTGVVGWSSTPTPTELVEDWVAQIDDQAVARSVGDIGMGPDGAPLEAVYLTEDGQDLQQLLQKFLLGAVTLSQAADDYLDDDEDGKGLRSDNTVAEEGEPYTALEHAWDEGFGYFGAARDYGDWSDATLDDPGQQDSWEADGSIDLTTEVSWGHSLNAGKRDLGAVVATDFSGDAFDAFVAGRHLITSADGALTDDQQNELAGYRDEALVAWESAIAATVVHYLNEVLVDTLAVGTDDYDFADHAKHFSEAKGFALAFQFNPHSALSADDFATLHALLGEAPVLQGEDELAAYADDLRAARTLIGDAFDFDTANLGDDDGQNGW